MDKKQVIQTIVEMLKPSFNKHGFENKRQRFFEKKEGENTYQYEIDLGNPKGHFSLHLKLAVLNREIANCYNSTMKKVLTDERMIFPSNWSPKDIDYSIKGRTSEKKSITLTDWRSLKEENESLEDFNSRYSIWLYAFDELNEKENWKEQLFLSVELAKKWFNKAINDEYLVENSDLFSLCILKMKNENEKLQLKFNEIIEKMKAQKQNTKEVEIFYNYLKQ